MNSDYLRVLEHVFIHGKAVSPRGMETRELLGVTITVVNPYGAMPLGCVVRKANPAIGVAEALQLISGRSYPRLLAKIASPFSGFMDGEVLQGAYGPRIRAQLPRVVDHLRRDPSTRQAVLLVWDPVQDLFSGNKDVACTLALQFVLRGERLELHTKMRSQDCWWGLAYDIFMFAELLGTVAHRLDAHVGTITHTVTSLHVYERDFDRINETLDRGVAPLAQRTFATGIGVGRSVDFSAGIKEVQDRAQLILQGTTPHEADEHERWMVKTLEPYRG
jgi:thymidylate synthase